tara:strand:+ start:1559 stop:1672 length:114 start_codon:yes stop_codon:yes gene_type:complete
MAKEIVVPPALPQLIFCYWDEYPVYTEEKKKQNYETH